MNKPKKFILIAEDEPILKDMYVETFESHGYLSKGFEDGAKALDFARDNDIDFVVTDLKMPNMDGMELLEELGKLGRKVPPVLIVTGFADEISTKRAKELGAVGLISKPFNFQNVIDCIEREIK